LFAHTGAAATHAEFFSKVKRALADTEAVDPVRAAH
jgi:hypothetical protein